jgi:hypothetical protein
MPSREISPPGIAQYHESLLAADIDRDGDSDFFSGEARSRPTWWFERTAEGWIRHLVSDSNVTDVACAALDVDGDGWVDKVSSGFWYRNPGFPKDAPSGKDTPFAACRYSSVVFAHDLYLADFDGDGKQEPYTLDFDGVHVFRIPGPDSLCGPWPEKVVGGRTEPQAHGGLSAGDLDGDGDADIGNMNRWYENADGKGGAWIEHANIPFGPAREGGWGLSGRALVADMDGDGHQDLIQAESDAPNGRVAWFANPGGKGLRWEMRLVKDSTEGQDFHSLIAADFDGDGDIDLFSAGSANSEGPPKAYVWENGDGKGGAWIEHVIPVDGAQIHDAAGADLDGDGDIDILAKDWATGRQFYLENQRVPNSGAGIRGKAGPSGFRAPAARLRAAGTPVFIQRDGRLRRADGRLREGR